MSNVKSKLSNRLIAAFLSVIMVIGMIPMSATPVFAATVEHPDAVTISVTDETGAAVEGATVTYTIHSDENGDTSGSGTTDQYGCVVVLPKEQYEEGLKLSAAVSKQDYTYAEGSGAIEEADITADDQDFSVKLRSTIISDVTIKKNTDLVYNGDPQSLVSINGAIDGDTVTIQIDSDPEIKYTVGEGQEIKAEKTDAGSYAVTVTVERKDYTKKVERFNVTIAKADMDIDISEKIVSYNEAMQDLVDLTGSVSLDDTVQWYVGGQEEIVDPGKVPRRKAVGPYSVRLVVTPKNNNYKVFDKTVQSEILLADLNISGLTIEANDLTYNGKDQSAISVENKGEYDLEFQLSPKNDSTFVPVDGAWNKWEDENSATVCDAGEYIIYVRAVKEGYNNAQYPTYPISVKVAKAKQSIEFVEDNPSTITLDSNSNNNIYDFSAEGDRPSGADIIYSLVDASDTNVASIDENTGELTIKKAGIVTVKALLPGNENYEDAVIYATITIVTTSEGLVNFGVSTKQYTLDEAGVASEEFATKLHDDDNGTLTYSISNKNIGLSIDENTGRVTVTDRNKLLSEMSRNNDSISVTITVSKTAGTATTKEWYFNNLFDWGQREITHEIYPADDASYTLYISLNPAPDFDTICEITDPDTTGWYNAAHPAVVTVKDASEYQIALDTQAPDEGFSDSVTITEQGEKTHLIFLQDKDGKYYSGIELDIKVDTVNPSPLKISYSESVLDKVLSTLTFGYYKSSVTVTFEASDETSWLSHLNWTYARENGASTANLASETGTLTFDANGKAELILTGDDAKQYRGNLSFNVTDIAGNTSEEMTDTDHIIVVDTIAPNIVISYADPVESVSTGTKQQRYFDDDVEITITVTETNFYQEEFVIKVSKDGAAAEEVTPVWNPSEESDNVFIGTFTLSGDADYIIYAEYKDRSSNDGELSDKYNTAATQYESDIITIDTIPPVIEFEYDRNAQTIKVIVTEHNFRATDLVVTGTIKDINGIDTGFTAERLTAILQGATWTQAGDKYTCELSKELENGIYDLAFDYEDISDNDADTNEPDVFIIDHDKPYNVKIEYNKSILDTVLETLTLGFYKPDVTITFTAYDDDGGVETFSWNYTQQPGTSSVNLAASSGTLSAVQDETDKSKFTATMTLTATEAEQLRGYISVSATDTFSNTSETITDEGYILVVDTISPTMTASYSQEDSMVGTNAFYKGDVTVIFRVTEANFFSEDVVVMVSKDGGAPVTVTPSWVDESVDVHVGTLILGDGFQDSSDANVASVGDGDYVITVEYTDRSTNEMAAYTSHVVTIDTIKPVIDVQYHNNNVINTLTDSEGNTREYFDAVQTATVTVTEHNFNADEVEFTIVGKDVTGAELNTANLYSASNWTNNGDIHTITLTYSGDANYTFDVAYTDLATNPADDYAEDYFTVDQTKPTNLTVSYSTSVLDTILENITFGFYNAEMTVTITADDSTSSVHEFKYSYLNAAGVSSVNAELVNERIEEAAITYSNGGRTATAEFKIPKMVLGNDNQFNGIAEFTATDRSGNESDTHTETHRVVVDNIAPNATVEYNDPVRTEGDISYYDGDVEVTVTITEANFYAEDVSVMISKDGAAATAVTPTWRDNSVDVHVGTFTLTEDGDYIITITYRDKSSNEMNAYESKQLTIDTEIEAPTIILKGLSAQGVTDAEIVGTENNTIYAFKDAIVPYVSFSDQNYDDYEITLTQVQRASDRSWSKQDLSSYISVADKSGEGDISLFALDKVEADRKLDDGIYQLTVSMTDKADHSSESTVIFTVNRFGSVYKYSDALVSLINSGGAYATWEEGVFMIRSEELQVGELTITEYNANRIVDGSLNIDITRDGRSVTDKQIDTPAGTGNGRENWFEYQYLISENNFTEDGTYRITISSEDEAKNTPESVPDNSIAENNDAIVDTILFRVDSTVPEITSIVGLENRIINEQTLDVRYTVYDAIGLKSVTVYVNGTAVQTVDNFDDLNNYSGTFTITESNSEQTVRILVEDLAGNVTDSDRFGETDADGNVIVPMPAYSFNRAVTVSTNFFVRWWANQPLFWGSIGGVVVLAGAFWFLIVFLRKKKKGDEK